MNNRKILIRYLFISYMARLLIGIYIIAQAPNIIRTTENSILIYCISAIVIFAIIDFILFYRLIGLTDKNNELAIAKAEFKNTEALISLFRKQGHDHINHIQTVSSMLMLDEHTVAMDYLQGIAETYRFSGHFLRLGNASLTAVVNTKKELANQRGIEFIVVKYCRVRLTKIKPWDMASIVGNLLDNSIEYLLAHKDLLQKIFFYVENTVDMKGYIFKIGNPYKKGDTRLEDLFNQGYSTKASAGRGYGLYIVRELVEGYNGSIKAEVSGDVIEFIVEVSDNNA